MSNDTADTTAAQIQSNNEMPDRDELVELRRNKGLTNDEIADEHFPQFTSRQIGLFASMYDVEKGWKDEAYLREQIEAGSTPEELAAQWPVKESTVRSWMAEFDIEENPIPDAFDNAISSLAELEAVLEEQGEAELAAEYGELANKLSDDCGSIFN